MIIRDTDTSTLVDHLKTLCHSRDHQGHNQRVLSTIRIQIKAIEMTLEERKEDQS